jgi:hypothetical protein
MKLIWEGNYIHNIYTIMYKIFSNMVFAYYKEGVTDPTFLYFAYALKEIKC